MNRTWLKALAIVVAIMTGLSAAGAAAKDIGTNDLKARFTYLSTHGNSSCSDSFMKSITTMPPTARLQGSCCSPMALQRYIRQVQGLRKYATFREIPPDPYDIEAGLARKMMAAYPIELHGAQQAAYTFAMRPLRGEGAMLLQVLALAGVWRARKAADSRPQLHRPAGHRGVESLEWLRGQRVRKPYADQGCFDVRAGGPMPIGSVAGGAYGGSFGCRSSSLWRCYRPSSSASDTVRASCRRR